METTRGSRATLDPTKELRDVAAQYEEYLALARVTEIPRTEATGVYDFYAPRPAPLTLTVAHS